LSADFPTDDGQLLVNRMYQAAAPSFYACPELKAVYVMGDRFERQPKGLQVDQRWRVFVSDDNDGPSLQTGECAQLGTVSADADVPLVWCCRLTDQCSASLTLSPNGRASLNSKNQWP
jgi:hypothetical protein